MTCDTSDDSGGLDRLRARLDRANFEILTEAEDNEILAEVREQALHHPGFREWLRGLPRTKDSPRAMVYEALVVDLDTHGDLLLEELDQALSVLGQVPDPRDVLLSFYELTEAKGSRYQPPIRDRVGGLLTSAVPEVRRLAVDLLMYFLEPTDAELVLRVRTLMEKDADWRVRHAARRTLEELELLPAGHQPSWTDRLRIRFCSHS